MNLGLKKKKKEFVQRQLKSNKADSRLPGESNGTTGSNFIAAVKTQLPFSNG